MSKMQIFKDPYDKYGEAKQVKRTGYSLYDDEKAPDYNEVNKALWTRRLLWMGPTAAALGLVVWLALVFGGPFLTGLFWLVVGSVGLIGAVIFISWLCQLGSDAGEVLESAGKHGVREPSGG